MTDSDTCPPTSKPSCSEPMVDVNRSDSVLKLGCRIVDELGLDQTTDTLGRWMAHYIAEKIEIAETATGEDRAQKVSACVGEILRFWGHRSQMPRGKRPFEDFEPIMHALESLDPNATTPRYFSEARSAAESANEASKVMRWLGIASGIDHAARVLIRYCLAAAVEDAVDKSREWVTLANEAEEKDIDIKIVILLTEVADAMNAESAEGLHREEIKKLLTRLDEFSERASDLSNHFREILARPPCPSLT
jgi:hypothetical protein